MDKSKLPGGEGMYDYFTREGTDVPPSKEEYSLEEILAEYGGSLEDQLLREAEKSIAGTVTAESGPEAKMDKTSAAETSTDPKTGAAIIPTDPKAGAAKILTDPEAGAVKIPTDPKASTAKSPTDPKASTAKSPTDPKAGAVKIPTDPEAGATKVFKVIKAGTVKGSADSRAGATKISTDFKAGTTKDSADSKAGATKDSADSRAGATKISTDFKAGTTKDSADSKTGATKDSADSKAGSTKISTDFKIGPTKDSADSRTGTTKDSADSRTGATKNSADSKAGATKISTDSKADITEVPTESSADSKPEIPHTGTAAAIHDDPIQAAEAAAAIDVEKLDLPESPRPISLEEVVNSTVEAVMEEGRQEPIKPRKRRGLFSRKPLEDADSERLPPPPEPEPEYDPEPIGPEPDMRDAAKASRNVFLKRKKPRFLHLIPGLLPTALLLAEERGLTVPYWTGDAKTQTVFLLACLLATALLCRQVFARAFEMVRQRRVTAELLVSFSVLAAAADCLVRLAGTERTDAMPYASVTCLGLVFAQWGVRQESRGTFDMFRCAALDDQPPYLVTDTPRGACKQKGSVPGFFTAAMRDDFSTIVQTAFLPLFGMGAVVFSGLCSFGQERNGDFFLNLSAILPAAATFSLPLSWSLPWSKLSERLQKNGAAVAGWSGAQKISRKRTMIVTDGDLFPPGTLQENGRKVYGEEPIKAIAYAASMAKTAGCGLEFFFRNLLRAENGRYEEVDEFSFFEEGGYSGVIHGETVLMGTHSFMRKMEIRLPGDVHLKNGVYLAVDRRLIAIFAVKYNPAENVDFALKLMRRCHVLPVLASRDPNITPALLRQKFSRAIKMEFPDLSERVALSEAEKDRDLPRALLFREGLLPYAETVAGSQRLCGAVRSASLLSLAGSFLGTLLAFYMLYLSAYSLLNPLALEVFLLLWTLPVLLISNGAGRY